jgi:glucokinase
MSNRMVLGLDIGGTKCAALLAQIKESQISILAREQIQTPTGWEQTLHALCAISSRLIETCGISRENINSLGISCGGPLDGKKGIILSPPNLPGWDRVPIVDYLVGCFHKPVRLKNDADACAVAEWKYGAGQGCENMIFLTFGTGLGAGLILNGKLYTGTSNLAGEAGHIRLADFGPIGYGKEGSFEGFCSGGGIRQIGIDRAQKAFQQGKQVSYCPGAQFLETINAQSIAKAAFDGAEDAREVYRISGHYFGKGLAILIDLLNPERIVVGSIYARSHTLLYDAMTAQLHKECLPQSLRDCVIVPAVLGEAIGDYAAVVAALDV